MTDRIETQVLVVGTGPAGATAGLFLARMGVDVVLLNKRWSTANTPRAHITNQRTMEVFRDAGIEGACVARATPAEQMSNTVWATSLAGEELARLRSWGTSPERRAEYRQASPTSMCDLPQDRLEPILVEAATRHGAKFRLGVELEDFEQDDERVVAIVRDRLSGERSEIVASYLVGADGANSLVAQKLGLSFDGERGVGAAVNVHFRADLSRFVQHRPGVLYWIVPTDPGTPGGNLRMVHPWDEWLAIFGARPGQDASLDMERARRQVVGLIGEDLPLEILRVDRWEINRSYASSYGKGRVWCAGDAVHCHPPPNGLGSNTAIQDAHNLAWKLALVLRGKATAALLDSYELERQPVGKQVVERAHQSFMEHGAVHFALGTMPGSSAEDRAQTLELLAAPGEEGRSRRQMLASAIQLKNYEFNCHGVEMNQRYRSAAIVVGDESPPDFHRDDELHYQATTFPGAKLPHAWLESAGATISTLDLVGADGFSVLTGLGGDAWRAAAEAVEAELGVDLACRIIAPRAPCRDPWGDWAALREVEDDGCLLVRPDGFVAWRTPSMTDDPRGDLTRVMRTILGPRA